MRSVYEWPQGVWWAYVWDERAATDGIAPERSMAYRRCESKSEAQAWCAKHERYVVTRYRAWCAYEVGTPCVKRGWAEHYREFATIDALSEENEPAG